MKYSGNTTNMNAHLRRRHPEINKAATTASSSTITAASTSSSRPTITGQMKLQESFQMKMPRNSQRAQDITRHIGIFIARDLRPFSVVENPGFRKLMEVLDPRYTIPSRPHFSETVIPGIYRETRATVQAAIDAAISVALTTDGWTSCVTESYLTITAHFVTSEWELKEYVLQTRPMHEAHTAQNIANVLRAAVLDWRLDRPNCLMALVTDNASNVVLAAREAGFHPHIGCFAHTVNLATQRALKVNTLARLLGRVRRIVTFFHRSTTAAHILKEKQDLLKLPGRKLMIDVSTRWNSSYDMLERFLQQQPAVTAALMSPELRQRDKDICTLVESDVSSAEDVVRVLKPIKTITTILCDAHHPTVSMILPMKEKIITSMKPMEVDSELVKNVKAAILEDISRRYEGSREFLLLSAVLDPRFRSLPMLDRCSRGEVFRVLAQKTTETHEAMQLAERNEAATSASASQVDEAAEPGEPPCKSTKSAIEDLLNDLFSTDIPVPEESPDVTRKIEQEVTLYQAQPSTSLSSDPLVWWRENALLFPHIATVAKIYLGVPATSVPSERVFSTAGDIVTSQRSRLSGTNVDQLIFLNKNLH